MNIYLTLDYELFFGQSGSAAKCMLEPTNRVARVCEKHGARCVVFVDAGYLDKLGAYAARYPQLGRDREQVVAQIRRLSKDGHDIQLHVHPHWEGTVYDGSEWVFDWSRYRLDAFSDEGALDIFERYITVITEITDKPISAFRAGGWCIQPFAKFQSAFERFNIAVDSTVFVGGRNSNPADWYDFSDAPDGDCWRFQTDPCRSEANGRFLELPIASHRVSPTFFWRLALTKMLKLKAHRSFGDGKPFPNSAAQLTRLLTTSSMSVVSIDGYKSSFLMKAYKEMKARNRDHFVVIGHPKALTEYSLAKLDDFLGRRDLHDEVATFSDVA